MIPDKLFDRNNQEFIILLDAGSSGNKSGKSDEDTKRIIRFSTSDYFKIMQIPCGVTDQGLKQITTYEVTFNGEERVLRINYDNGDYSIGIFPYSESDIAQIACRLHGRNELIQYELDAIRLVLIQAKLNRDRTQNCIFVTTNEALLKNRIWLKTRYSRFKLNIVSVNEAIEIMDLFLKFNQNYCLRSRYTSNEGGWYWMAFRYLIPHFNVSSGWMKALSNRFIYLLMSIDRMGFEYYLGVDRDTHTNLIYYFNYYVSLVTGIMDNLALESKDTYSLTFIGHQTPSRTSLYKKAGKEFLRSLGQKDKALRVHIRNNGCLINPIYRLRDAIIHREMPETYITENPGRRGDTTGGSGFVELDKDTWDMIHHLSKNSSSLDTFSTWGTYQDANSRLLLEPFTFCRAYLRKLSHFVDSFLEHLGYPDFVSDTRQKTPSGSFSEMMDDLSENSLIYYERS